MEAGWEMPAMSSIALAVLVSVVAFVCVWCQRAQDRADKRAELLLQQHLTTEQLANLNRTGSLQVPSRSFESRVYTVPIRGFVSVHDEGRLVMRLCVRPGTFLPGREAILAHKMYIEAAEEEYVESATVVWRAMSLKTSATAV
jgi:hypothetical protein